MIQYWITLNEAETRICTWVGQQRFSRRGREGLGKGPSKDEYTPALAIRGALCEFAASLFANVYWRPIIIFEQRERDIGGLIEVRSGTELNHRLIVKPHDDSAAPFVLIIMQPKNRFGFGGWMLASEAKTYRLLTEHGDPAHYVTQRELHTLSSLHHWIWQQQQAQNEIAMPMRA